MTFLNGWFLWLLIPLALLAWLRYSASRSERLPVHPKVILSNRRSVMVRLAPFAALAWFVVALARPVTTERTLVATPSLGTLYLAIDASASMRAQDRRPDRFGFAKAAIEKLVSADTRHRFALLAFTTNTLILSPPTEDKAIIHAAIEAFNPDFVLTRGTSLKALLEYVAQMEGQSKELVIFSDGGDGEDFDALIELARKAHIRVYGVACASRKGSRVPASGGGWLKDRSGHIVISMQNPILERLSIESGGGFVDAATPAEAAETLMAMLEAPAGQKGNEKVRYREYFWVPLLLGLLFYLYGTLGMESLRRRVRRMLVPLFTLAGLQAQAGVTDLYHLHKGYEAYHAGRYKEALEAFRAVDPPLLESRYGEASTLYRLGAYKKAGRIYASLRSKDAETKRRIWYNLGNCAAKLGRYKSAIDYYAKALALGEDNDTRANLRTVIFLQEQKRSEIAAKANRKVEAASRSGGAGERKEGGRKGTSSGARMSGSGSESASKATSISRKKGSNAASQRHPMGSKVYEMINRGYVHETKPW